MREIKFRAWDIANKEMIKVDVIDFFLEEIRVIEESGQVFSMGFKYVELMQSTGLQDKNGVEIFEGDVVKAVSFAKWIGVVKYLPEKAAFVLDEIEPSEYREPFIFLSQFQDGFEVLGNIYENADLLEVEE